MKNCQKGEQDKGFIETAQIIEELTELAKEMREASNRGEKLGLTEDELALIDWTLRESVRAKICGGEKLDNHSVGRQS